MHNHRKPASDRRVTFFGTTGMLMLDIQNRASRIHRLPGQVYGHTGDDMLAWIEKYTEGPFYLSDFSVAFSTDYDLMMFKLAFNYAE